ncbi:MAG: AraC family transcriptional regulator [Eubacteriales bacterium]|nr:AraC family transcriptional regulator [Eubacteriales bacterium]
MEKWNKVKAVARMQDYIASHIKEPITLRMLAEEAGYSPWHAARIFKELVGRPPFDYIRTIRLSLAAKELYVGSKVIDVSLDFVFGSHEGFTRAFSKQFGMPPKIYAKEKPPIKTFMPMNARAYYLTKQKGETKMSKNTNTVFVQVVERPQRKLIIKRGKNATHYYEYCEEVGCDIWDVLSGIKDALYEPIGVWLPKNMIEPGTSMYAQGVEVAADYSGKGPDGYDVIDLPPCKMMVFQGPPFDDEKFEAAIGDLWEVMKTYDPKIYGFEWAEEDAPRFQLAPIGYRGYIEARPVRPL